MKNEIRILVKEPGGPWKKEQIPNTLQSMQEKVGGKIESVTVASDACIICNEEGLITGLPFNCCFMGIDFFGTILLVGTTDCQFFDLGVFGNDYWRKGE